MVDIVEIFTMLPAVTQSSPCDLWKLTCSVECSRRKGVRWSCKDGPEGGSWAVACWIQRFTVVKKAFVVAIPSGVFMGEGIGGVGGALVMTVDLSKAELIESLE